MESIPWDKPYKDVLRKLRASSHYDDGAAYDPGHCFGCSLFALPRVPVDIALGQGIVLEFSDAEVKAVVRDSGH